MKQIEYKSVSDIKEYENNPRIISKEAIEKVANSIKEFGFRNPILIDANNVIIAGHNRIKTAKKLKITEVPCIVCDDLDETKVKALRLADNKVGEFSVWDNPLLKEELTDIDFDMSEFGFEFEDVSKIEEDIRDIAEIEIVDPEAKQGDIYRLGDHYLICGDSTEKDTYDELFNKAGVKEADMILTDPHYNVNYKSGGTGASIQNDNMNEQSFIEFISDFWKQALNRLKSGGGYYEWFAIRQYYSFETAHRKSGISPKQILIWEKSNSGLSWSDYRWIYESCFYGWKEGGTKYFYPDRALNAILKCKNERRYEDMSKDEIIKLIRNLPTDIIYASKPSKCDLHPTMKPIELMSQLIRNSSRKGNVVLDCFGGSGSTLIACEKMERKCLMIELDEHYVDVIVKRWEDLTGSKAEKIS